LWRKRSQTPWFPPQEPVSQTALINAAHDAPAATQLQRARVHL
jgi:hypothetical protein